MKTLEELKAIRDRMQNQMSARHMNEEVAARKLQHVTVTQTGCIGMCKFEPIVEVYVPGLEKVTYIHVTPEKAARIISDHIVNGNVVDEFTIREE